MRCSGDAFAKKFFDKNIAAFQLVGYSAWNGEGAGSNPACYTMMKMLYKLARSSKGSGYHIFAVMIPPLAGRVTNGSLV